MPTAKYGAVSAGHPLTAQAAIDVLQSGGNAFDAVIAATATACICEPILASLGGGGFLTARTADQKPKVYDFFVQTPRNKTIRHCESDFFPVSVDFGATQQEFHIGNASIATPGLVKGLFKIHRDLGRMPLSETFSPAIENARKGVELNKLQAYLYSIISPILLNSTGSSEIFSNSEGKLLQEGERQHFFEMADLMESLAIEGEDLFYRGEVCQSIVNQSKESGYLKADDFHRYEVVVREPYQVKLGQYDLYTNPLPSSGGALIGFALQLLEGALGNFSWGSAGHLHQLIGAMDLTQKARLDPSLLDEYSQVQLGRLDGALLSQYRQQMKKHAKALRGTTHISVVDTKGNQASLTLSNGEGCGDIVPGCGFMLNNMLGEEDLNPAGLGNWTKNTRMTSMMAPSLLRDNKNQSDLILGSGGSNRIRSAILQVLINIMHYKLPIEEAVSYSRLHFEGDRLNIEPGFGQDALKAILQSYPDAKIWDEQNLYFGGVHSIMAKGNDLSGCGDARRDGVCRIC